jgi:hypothetical protein
MELPPDIFQELTAGGRFAPQSAASELRAAPRVQATLSVLLLRLNGDKNAKPMPATVRDLSTRGVGLEFHEPIHVNDPFALRVQRADGSALWIHCVSVRWSHIDGKACSIGAKFTGISMPSSKAVN